MVIMVLKIIGIVLLVILGLFLFILSLLLFLPVRYRFDGKYEDTLNGKALVTWFPVLLKADITVVDGKPSYVVKLFAGVVMTNTEKKISWIGRKLFASEEEDAESKKNKKDKNIKETEKSSDTKNETLDYPVDSYEDIEFEKPPERKKVEKKLSIYDKIKKKIDFCRRKWKNFVSKLKEIHGKKEQLLKVYHSKRFEQAKADVILYLKKLFQIVKPNRLEGNVVFGFENPELTGKSLGVLAMVLPTYQKFLTIRPDFTKSVISGNLKGKGKIYIFSVLKLAIKIKFNENLIKVIKKVQTIIEA